VLDSVHHATNRCVFGHRFYVHSRITYSTEMTTEFVSLHSFLTRPATVSTTCYRYNKVQEQTASHYAA